MKLKEIERTANVSWSPGQQYPVYLACGTAAQQLDATFSTKSVLEIFKFNPEEPGSECELISAVETDHRFNKVVWGNLGINNGSHPSGVIVGAAENGTIHVWDAAKMIMEEDDSQLLNLQKHTGNVSALDFNKFQDNLLASGGSDSEILLWDINNPTTPMTPGAKSQPADDVSCLAWNCQVQHILASALNTRCVVWDLRKNEPIIKISDSMSRIKSKLVTWHPEVATQLVLASEDDHTPVVQLWDLRFAASPIKVLERHQRGILSMAWSRADADLFITCGKDNRLICWNANTDVVGGEVTYELPIGNQWCFDVQWCPRNPQCLSACSFDGRVSVYTIMGGEMTDKPASSSNKIADSFGGFDAMPAPQSAPKPETRVVPQISKAPNWLKRPAGASFAFGGKLVCFSNTKTKDPAQPLQKKVSIHQVITEDSLIRQSHQLEHAIHNRQYSEYCSLKITNSREEQEATLWHFLKVNFESEPRNKYLDVLGFKTEEIAEKIASLTSTTKSADEGQEELSSHMSSLSAGGDTSAAAAFDHISQDNQLSAGGPGVEEITLNSTSGTEGLLTQALLTGKFDQAVDLCINENRMADAIILATAAGESLLQKTMKIYFKQSHSSTSQLISAVVQKDYNSLIANTNLENWKELLALILTYAKPEEYVTLCDKLGARLESSPDVDISSNAVFCYICSGNIDKFVDCWSQQSDDSHPTFGLQDLIEKVMMLRKAYERNHGQEYPVQAQSPLARKLSDYAEKLAAEGSLVTALSYLPSSAKSQKLLVLRYRLLMALHQHAGEVPWPKQPAVKAQQQPQQQSRNRAGQQRLSSKSSYDQQQPYQQPYQPQQPYYQQPSSNYTTSYYNGQTTNTQVYSSYNGSAQTSSTYNYSTPTQHSNYSTQPYSSAPAIYQPSPTQTATSSMYGQTPTYPSQPYGASTGYSGYQQPAPQPAGHIASRGLLGKKYAATSSAETSQSSVSAVSTAPVSFFNPAAVPSTGPMQPGSMQPVGMQAGQYTSPSNSSSYMATSGAPAAQFAQPPAPLPNVSASVDEARKAPSGWNDPPPVHSKEPESPTSTSKSAPITQPVYNPNAMMQPSMAPPNQQYVGQQAYGSAGMVAQPQQYTQQTGYNAQAQQPAQLSPKATAPAQPAEVIKPPLPERHQVLKEVLDSLAKKCHHASTNPQQKRKLEDVLKKLEFLYDKLRNGNLNESVLTGLHQIVSAIKQYDYQTGLAVHTSLVMQGNFSEISAFMPGVKMLMQTALQLQVFV